MMMQGRTGQKQIAGMRVLRLSPGGIGWKVALAPANVFAWFEVVARAVAI